MQGFPSGNKCNFRDPSKQSRSRPQPANSFPTPIKVERLLLLAILLNRHFHSTVTFLLSGFTRGFPLHFEVSVNHSVLVI